MVQQTSLRSGASASCGCLNREVTTARNLTHGKSKTPVHNRWLMMLSRCRNPRDADFCHYGGRGIRVCDRWAASFEAFLADMGEPPAPRMEIDRIDNDGAYEPGNCRWATHKENLRHTRRSRFLEHDGLRLTVSQWAERLGIGEATIRTRIDRYGWSVADALTRPVEHHRTTRG
jgi:hypothetical protein